MDCKNDLLNIIIPAVDFYYGSLGSFCFLVAQLCSPLVYVSNQIASTVPLSGPNTSLSTCIHRIMYAEQCECVYPYMSSDMLSGGVGWGFKPHHLHIFITTKSQAGVTAAWPFASKEAV